MTERDPEKLKRKLFDFANDFPFFKLIGYELLDIAPGSARARIALRPDLCNPNGVMHGGVIATLMDISITQAMLMTDEYQAVRDTRGSMTSVDLRVRYLRPISAGFATCEAHVPHLGKRVGHASAVVKNDQGKEVALGESMLLITIGEPRT
jgi:uncharacterized protein (TIGR00369 family)